MKLKDILQNCGVLSVQGDPELEITHLTNDSRQVQPGSLFIAVNGCGNDGRQYIDKAIEAGAAAVLFEESQGCDRPGEKESSSLQHLTNQQICGDPAFRSGNARSAAPSDSSAPAPDSGAEIGFSSNCTKNNFRPPAGVGKTG